MKSCRQMHVGCPQLDHPREHLGEIQVTHPALCRHRTPIA
jgi:hypothetical protein